MPALGGRSPRSVVEKQEISIREHAYKMAEVEPVAWVSECKVAPEPADAPDNAIELRRDRQHGIEMSDRQKDYTCRCNLKRVRMCPLFGARDAPAHGNALTTLELIPGSALASSVRSVKGLRNRNGSHTSSSVPVLGFHRRMPVPDCNRAPCGASPASKNGSLTILPK